MTRDYLRAHVESLNTIRKRDLISYLKSMKLEIDRALAAVANGQPVGRSIMQHAPAIAELTAGWNITLELVPFLEETKA